ncbi:ADP-ribosylation factor-like protein [Leishmania mexicana MHOM/GT/2001/U1103]|uniref:ADP-ribosylation factor-like protein n=1 Tax=Leishmania mexicana (strain MHOM/GT/2001/U1103) TaxID=929439 RepID=E9ASK2_LEIMU|nr:ADP-ribosylation factor-like protein [Leishmania mexicana MHOM/GT/2001/U1103]CBZ25925.1 ADP-ribosylation factor-like protein [Leishmania mexicana MHOM/GT/2001/U1103]
MSKDDASIAYAKRHNIHHLFELMATKVLLNRPENPFAYLRNLLKDVEESEKNRVPYDPTQVHFNNDVSAAAPPAGDSGGSGAAAPAATPTSAKKEKRTVTLATFGLDQAGKTCALSVLESGEADTKYTPTIGFSPIKFPLDDYNLCVFDLGGAANFRGIWVHYYHDCFGIVYVIDSAASDERVAESLKVLHETLQHPYVKGKPLLVLANKKDLPESRGVGVVPQGFLEEAMGEPTAPHRVLATCAIEDDPTLVEGIEWLLEVVSKEYDALVKRVAKDSDEVKNEKARQRAARLAEIRGENK